MSVFFLTGCRVSAVTGACVGHLETDGVEHYLHVTEKRNKKRRKILLDAARPVLAYVARAGIGDDREGPLFRPLTPDGPGWCGGTSTARPPGGWSRNTARPPASTRRGWAAAASASTRLRKTAINDAIRNGATMHEVREFAGHSRHPHHRALLRPQGGRRRGGGKEDTDPHNETKRRVSPRRGQAKKTILSFCPGNTHYSSLRVSPHFPLSRHQKRFLRRSNEMKFS